METRSDMAQCWAVRQVGGRHQFLLLRRAAGDYMGGTWQPVSGRIEPGETAWRAALRELDEETGLSATDLYTLDHVHCFYIPPADTLWHSVPFCAMVDPDAVVRLNDEHDDFRWIDRDDIDGELLWHGDRFVARRIGDEILDHGRARGFLRIDLDGA